jgi:16S rRNA G1207 methylase RsmC
MRDHNQILKEYQGKNVVFIHHEWGQNYTSLYNRVAKLWNSIDVGTKIAIISNKKLGIKSAVKFLEQQGLTPKIIGKGPDNLRLVELEKNENRTLEKVDTMEAIGFNFNDREYKVSIGDAIFSRAGLDVGTRFLLDVVLDSNIDFNNKRVGDFGSGWGAISLVLINEFPNAKIFAYEKDESSLEVSRLNLADKNINIQQVDLTKDLPLGEESLDYIVSNPPFHIGKEDRQAIFRNARRMLNSEGELFFLSEGHFIERFRKSVKEFFTIISEERSDLYIVFRCKKI